MAKTKFFDLWSAGEEFDKQGHNPRTRAAWECGVSRAATGGRHVYQGSAADYAAAERAGREYAVRLLNRGYSFRCRECGALHTP